MRGILAQDFDIGLFRGLILGFRGQRPGSLQCPADVRHGQRSSNDVMSYADVIISSVTEEPPRRAWKAAGSEAPV
jgi:hypothetical protein